MLDLQYSVLQAYGRDLMEAQDWCRKYMRSGNVKDLTQAWDLYYHVFRRISKQLPQVGETTESLHLINMHSNSSSNSEVSIMYVDQLNSRTL